MISGAATGYTGSTCPQPYPPGSWDSPRSEEKFGRWRQWSSRASYVAFSLTRRNKIISTGHFFGPDIPKMHLRGSPPQTRWGANSAPQTSWLDSEGALCDREEKKKRKAKGGKGKREGKEGKERKGEDKHAEPPPLP